MQACLDEGAVQGSDTRHSSLGHSGLDGRALWGKTKSLITVISKHKSAPRCW